jgi:LysR family transcriptional regulator, flagellar master operon regulator
MDLELFKTFLAVNQHRHFSLAAQQLFVSQAAVSSRIKHLENQLGEKLFIRERNNLQLTQSGLQLIPFAESFLALWEEAQNSVKSALPALNELKIFADENVWFAYLNEQFSNINALYPETNIHLNSCHEAPIEPLLDGRANVYFSFNRLQHAGISCKQINKIKLVLATNTHGIELKTSNAMSFLNVNWSLDYLKMYEKNIAANFSCNWKTNSVALALNLLKNGDYCIYFPHILMQDNTLNIVEGAPDFELDLYVHYLHTQRNSSNIQSILNYIGH